jgi:RNA polymerase sigma-70 factor (ECF subfamily)
VTGGPAKEVGVDDSDFLEAFTEHLDRLHNLARGLTRCAQDAEDLVSETCLLALRGWRRQPPDDAAAWFATICLNAARSSYRRRGARPVEVSAEDWLLERADDGADTAWSALAAVQARRVREAVAQLPPPQLEAIALMDLSGYTAAQTAAIVGAPRGTILARVHRGRKVLARSLEQDREGGER